MPFDASTAYNDLGNQLPEASDLSPVGVASVGAKAQLSHLAIFRDIYYIADDMSYRTYATRQSATDSSESPIIP